MKIAWFTPFSLRSAIGEFSLYVTSAINEESTVDLWVVDAGERRWKTRLRVKPADRAVASPDLLDDYDVVVYNVGNYSRYHGEILDVLERRAGIAILHDRTYYDLYRARWRDRGASFTDRLAEHYGEVGLRHALESGEAQDAQWQFPLSKR